jgi:hypothetical protein
MVEGRECVARFTTEAEARACAALLRTRDGVQNVQMVDEDGVPCEDPPVP